MSLSDVIGMSKVDLISNFAGKYVFIGESGTIIHDQIVSPVDGRMMDGVESHAHFLDGIVQGRYLRDATMIDMHFIAIIVLLILLMASIYLLVSKYTSLVVAILLTIFLLWLGRYLYFVHAIVLEMLPLLLAGSVFTFPITFIYRFFIVDREKRMLTSAFAHYIDPGLVAQIAERADTIELG